MNKPYVKTYDETGVTLLNPIIGEYKNSFLSRAERRRGEKRKPFYGNSKNHHLTVTPYAKYLRHIQTIVMESGEIRRIEHYLLK